MEAIKGRGLAGAQLTTSGAGEEGDTDQDPRFYREGTSELQGGGGLAICSAVCLSVGADLASLAHCLSIFLLEILTLPLHLRGNLKWSNSVLVDTGEEKGKYNKKV